VVLQLELVKQEFQIPFFWRLWIYESEHLSIYASMQGCDAIVRNSEEEVGGDAEAPADGRAAVSKLIAQNSFFMVKDALAH